MLVTQIIYASRPFGYDELALRNILLIARRNNARDGISGALICREDLFLQLLEGRRDVVQAALDRIRRDDRHTDLHVLVDEDVSDRLFPDWAMRHDPARSWMWSATEVAAGAVRATAPAETRAVFTRLAREPAEDPSAAPGCPHKGT